MKLDVKYKKKLELYILELILIKVILLVLVKKQSNDLKKTCSYRSQGAILYRRKES